MCHFLWPYVVHDDGTFGAHFRASAQFDTLGVCIAIDHYKYDVNGDGAEDTPLPDCATLPPNGPATPGDYDDASDFGCQTYAHSPTIAFVASRATADVRLHTDEPLVVQRHPLD